MIGYGAIMMIPSAFIPSAELGTSISVRHAQFGMSEHLPSYSWEGSEDLNRYLGAWLQVVTTDTTEASGYSSVFGNCARYALPDAIVQLKDFPDDWDGYDAVAPLAAAIDDARKFASIWWSQTRPALSVGPLSNGAVHLWWENDDSLAELEFDGSGIIAAFARSRGAAPKISAEVALSDIGAMRGLIRDFTAAINAFTTQS